MCRDQEPADLHLSNLQCAAVSDRVEWKFKTRIVLNVVSTEAVSQVFTLINLMLVCLHLAVCLCIMCM